jgi:hypothetical protein
MSLRSERLLWRGFGEGAVAAVARGHHVPDVSAGALEFGDLGVGAVEDGFESPTLGLAGGVAVVAASTQSDVRRGWVATPCALRPAVEDAHAFVGAER